MKLVELLNQWFREHSQTELAASAEVKQSTVSRWKNIKTPPSFESCLRIARAMNEDPVVIFEAADRQEFVGLFNHFCKGYEPKPAPTADLAICADHLPMMQSLEKALHLPGNDKWIPLLQSFIDTVSGKPLGRDGKRNQQAGGRDPLRSAKDDDALSKHSRRG